MPFPLTLTDDLGRTVTLPAPPRRIVSLVPSQTELLAYLELDDAVVGVTRFCVRPAGWTRRKTVVGGTKQLDGGRLRALAPDLVLANREENTPAMVAAASDVAPVFVTDVGSVDAALAMIRTVGRLTDRPATADALADRIAGGFAALPAFAPRRAAYLIWREPFMTVGSDTFIHDVLARGGLVNVFGDRTRYPAVSLDELRTAAPDLLLLSSEPYPFDERHAAELGAALPGTAVHLVDGEPCSWYGPRLLQTPAYLARLRHDVRPSDPPNQNDR